jgi:hypothetical protein
MLGIDFGKSPGLRPTQAEAEALSKAVVQRFGTGNPVEVHEAADEMFSFELDMLHDIDLIMERFVTPAQRRREALARTIDIIIHC